MIKYNRIIYIYADINIKVYLKLIKVLYKVKKLIYNNSIL